MKAKKLTYVLGMMIIILAFVSCGQKSSSTPNSEADGSFDQSPSVLLGAVTIEPSEQERIVMASPIPKNSFTRHFYHISHFLHTGSTLKPQCFFQIRQMLFLLPFQI